MHAHITYTYYDLIEAGEFLESKLFQIILFLIIYKQCMFRHYYWILFALTVMLL